MRIMFWTEFFLPSIGGVERSATFLLAEMRKLAYEFVIVTSHHNWSIPDEELWHGIPVHRFSFGNALEKGDATTLMREQRRLERLVTSFDPELHHIFCIGPIMVACLQILKKRPAPFIVSLCNVELRPQYAYAQEG